MKILYFDTETTGTDPNKHEIVQFAAIVEIDGVVVDEINLRCQPTNWDAISDDALAITGLTVDMLRTFPTPNETAVELESFFETHINKFDKKDKLYPAGHNVNFDIQFLQKFWKQHISAYGTGAYQNWRCLDSRVLANFVICYQGLSVEDVKLETLCKHFGIELDAHDALNDIRATRDVIKRLLELLDNKNEVKSS